jgi:hypothetical protein
MEDGEVRDDIVCAVCRSAHTHADIRNTTIASTEKKIRLRSQRMHRQKIVMDDLEAQKTQMAVYEDHWQ